MVSFRVSPLVPLVILGSANPITRAPRRLAAVSKLKRVLVEGSKNNVATTLPLRISLKLNGEYIVKDGVTDFESHRYVPENFLYHVEDFLFGEICDCDEIMFFHLMYLICWLKGKKKI